MITAAEAKAELLRRRARVDLLAFLAYCWWMPTPLRIGRHTRQLCNRLTVAVDDYILRGKTTYLLTNMPFRHDEAEAYLFERSFEYFAGKLEEDRRVLTGAEQDGKEK